MQRGFSLIELSIVLVILGLLTGGILAGQSLIRAAEMRSVTADTARYMTAVHTFRDKYFGLPGDLANATKFWGEQHATPATCQTTSSSTALTCNGNGDGRVLDGTYEMFRFWQHLANAGLAEGSYTGIAGSAGGNHHVAGTNCPTGKLNMSAFGFSYIDFVGDAATYQQNFGNMIWVGRSVASSTAGRPQSDILLPEEAWNLDTKLDDGMPGRGSVWGRSDSSAWGTASACTTSSSNTDYAGNYNLSVTTKTCALMIKTGI